MALSESLAPVDGCYLLHFERPIYGAQHYLGWSVDIRRRVRLHLRGKGARLVRQALRAGIDVQLVRVWATAARQHERVLKRQTPKRYCPRCRRIAPPDGDDLARRLAAACRPTMSRQPATTPSAVQKASGVVD